MEISAVGVSATDLGRAVSFYSLLGFSFPAYDEGEDHVESSNPGARLMIDTVELLTGLLGEPPRAANTAAFAVRCDTPGQVDGLVTRVVSAGHGVVTEPFDAFWGQRYATVADPDGHRVDLYAPLPG
jgi:uncharacterized glyoxalase superfamily protein PhnB